jgi:hypothetical protein
MEINQKYCWICKHIDVNSGWCGTDITPGDISVLECKKGHWDVFDGGMYSGSAKKLQRCLSMAENCKDLELGDWMTDEKPSRQSTGECVMVCTPGEPSKIIELKE